MVAIVHTHGEKRYYRIERHTFNILVQPLQILLVSRRQRHHTTEIVVNDADLDPRFRFLQKNF